MTVEEDQAAAAAASAAREEAARQQQYVRERLERKPSEQITLDDIIYEMQHSGSSGANNNNANPGESGVFSSTSDVESSAGGGGDVYSQLEQKERDLMLAAELGKALLDKNEELSRQNERIAEEYSSKLEVGLTNAFYDRLLTYLQF